MKRLLIVLFVASLVAGACSSDESSDEVSTGDGAEQAAAGPFSPPPPAGSETIPTEPGSYNYSPAVIDEGGVIKAWWCSAVPEAATDNIWYQEYDKKTKKASKRKSVLQTGTKPTDWDTFGVCHPTVIRGSWPGRAGGQEATYAMYYTSTNVSQGGGSNNSTGVVFSADGISWHGQHDRFNPMIKQKVPNVPGTYGAGLPSAWSRGGSAVTLFWTDTTAERRGRRDYASRTVLAQSDDGIEFGPTTLVTQNGAPAYWKNDFAIDDSVQPAVVYSAQAATFRPGTGKDDKNETFNFGLYRIPMDELLAGGGQWEHLGVVDTNLTGFPLNFEPGLVRTGEGKIAEVEKDGLRVWFGGGGQTPFTWGLRAVTLNLGEGRLPLRRYSRSSGGTTSYWVTTGFVPASFRSGGDKPVTLGLLDTKPGAGVNPLYACQRGPLATDPDGALTGAGADRFVSVEPCPDDVNPLGTNGYLLGAAPAGSETKPLYACKDGAAQFVSNDPKCEGKTVERLLGHAHSG